MPQTFHTFAAPIVRPLTLMLSKTLVGPGGAITASNPASSGHRATLGKKKMPDPSTKRRLKHLREGTARRNVTIGAGNYAFIVTSPLD